MGYCQTMTDLALADTWTTALANITADLAPESAVRYRQRLTAFRAFMVGRTLSKASLGDFKQHLAKLGLSASTISGHLSAVRRLLGEFVEAGYLTAADAAYIGSIRSPKQRGVRAGKWLTVAQANSLLKIPDTDTLKGLRDKAILAMLLTCGLRRAELVSLTLEHIQQREGHTCLVDMSGKGGRIRTVKIPVPVKRLIDEWLEARGGVQSSAPLFVPVLKGGRLNGSKPMSSQAVYNLVRQVGKAIGEKLAAHDLRRTFAKMAHAGGAPLPAISYDLGHASLETTQRYLGLELDLDDTSCDHIKLKL